MPQLVANSGVKRVQLPSHPPPTRMTSAPPEPPFIEMPCGKLSAAVQVAALPGSPVPAELWIFHAPEPSGGSSPPDIGQLALIGAVAGARPPRFQPAIATLERGESSPKTGARNDVPQVPRIVKSSIGAQLNATLGLLVPCTSL